MGDSTALFLGLDLGTSGCRAIAIDATGTIRAQAVVNMALPERDGAKSQQAPSIWWQAVCQVLRDITQQVPAQSIRALAVDGTSGTLLLADESGAPLGPALMYNDGRSQGEAKRIDAVAPRESAAHGTTSALAKLLHLRPDQRARYALHQADWIVGKLTSRFGVSDANNCLKLGYDAVHKCWPAWLGPLGINRRLLPEVFIPGTVIGHLSLAAAQATGLSPQTEVVAGTTDSTAAFIAAGATQVGEAVTSLGSTLVMKIITAEPIFAPEFGVYSQPLGKYWLAGGGSNSGGAVLLHYFSKAQMAEMTPNLRPDQSTGLDYYPLLAPGERFPINDPLLAPHLEPRPENDVLFFQAMLEGMARIEHEGYRRLQTLGAPYPSSVRSAGGGAKNIAWTQIRSHLLGIPMLEATQQEAAYGTALIARDGIRCKQALNQKPASPVDIGYNLGGANNRPERNIIFYDSENTDEE
ncbi:MAG: FGGY-family carbohydrate kinase [Gammaproteobacteria bacterium]|nr:FGGY-family carbohydrate kinase [Gammaproteobacteria bacterium]